jgi:zona occludens toxin
MLTLITGVPGSGKSLYGVWELLRPMQTATVEVDGQPVKRVLYTNIKNLLLDHELINGDNLNNWHEWAKPGALIAFDEVQEVWRPRAMGSKVPDCIAKLETHRHMAVDMVLITQHPNLLDQNIRRLVGRHLHVRRVANMPLAIVYEWDHCSNPSQVRNAMSSRPWRYPGKKGYSLYKSAEAHTKVPRRMPGVVVALGLILAGLAYAVPSAYDRIAHREAPGQTKTASKAPAAPASAPKREQAPYPNQQPPRPALAAASAAAPTASAPQVTFAGCARMRDRCTCFDTTGKLEEKPPEFCADTSLANAPAKLADVPDSLARFEPPSGPVSRDPHADALIAWADRQADMRRAGR